MNINWLTEKFNPRIIGLFLVGLLVGGLAIGILDTKRPKPLFSAAAPAQCQSYVDTMNQIIDEMNQRPISQDRWDDLFSQRSNIFSEYVDCRNAICDPIYAELQEAWIQEQNWRNTLDQLEADRDEFMNSNPQPWSQTVSQQFQQLMLQLFNAEDQVIHYNEVAEEVGNRYDEAECTDYYPEDMHSIDRDTPLDSTPSYGYTGGVGTGYGYAGGVGTSSRPQSSNVNRKLNPETLQFLELSSKVVAQQQLIKKSF